MLEAFVPASERVGSFTEINASYSRYAPARGDGSTCWMPGGSQSLSGDHRGAYRHGVKKRGSGTVDASFDVLIDEC